ncbi:MAG: tetratricopeptide repeat protein [bacterium]|nr:tetratricopeptide repeat protein [bacterium]
MSTEASPASDESERAVAVQADLGRAIGRLGEALRFAGRTAEALECKISSLEIWRALGRSRAVNLAMIRLAIVLDESDRRAEALEILRELRGGLEDPAPADDLAVYADFIHEALALALFRQGDAAAALPELEAALKIRNDRGQAQMMERTRDLLQRIGDS